MDLIYQNADRVDLGVMKNYEMDLAYGKNENDFVLSLDLDEHCLEEGYILYMEGTEYGGIVDKIKASNVDDTVTYSGRTWHGVLESKIMEPVGNNDYLLLNGNANEVLKELIEAWGLTDLFSVSEEESTVNIVNYQVRYAKGYTGIRQMLFQFGGKLLMRYTSDRVVLSAEPYIDYSQDEEFDSSQVCFTSEKDYRPLNHLICIGLGELNEPYTIHLFCDEYGSLQAYATVDIPVKDSDYILTKEKQKLFGKDEVAEVLDNGSVQVVKNYVPLNEMPEGWDVDADTWNDRFSDVYTLNKESEFKQVEAKMQEVYDLQLAKPADWRTNYDEYYVIEYINVGSGEVAYTPPKFEGDEQYSLLLSRPFGWERNCSLYYEKTEKFNEDGILVSEWKEVSMYGEEYYTELIEKPNDWEKCFNNYYARYSDGVNKPSYNKVAGVSKEWYDRQTSKPTDWSTNYGSYYQKSGKDYVNVIPNYKKESEKPDDWKTTYSNYYLRSNNGIQVTYKKISAVPKESYEVQNSKPTDWSTNYTSYYYKDGDSYKSVKGDTAPKWNNKTYYTQKTEQVAPAYNSVKPVYGAYAPAWKSKPRFTKMSKSVAPAWTKNTYYVLVQQWGAPEWKAGMYYEKSPEWKENTYYTKTERMAAPGWTVGLYYRQHLDHYARLVEKGIEQIRKKTNSDAIDIALELENIYDINDIIGARENVTGLAVWMPITKKIVKITDTTETVEYEVGE